MLNARTLASIAFCGVAATSAFAQFFNNPGFETGDLSGWTVTPTPNGQTLAQNVEMFDIDGAGPLGLSNAGHFIVGQVTFQSGVQAGIELTQVLSLIGGQTYTLGFNWAAFNSATSGSNAQGGVFSMIVDGNALATQAAGSINGQQTISGRIDVPFTPTTSGNYTVGARITRPFTIGGNVHQYVDNFSPVPEPASIAALGLGAIALIRRRRK